MNILSHNIMGCFNRVGSAKAVYDPYGIVTDYNAPALDHGGSTSVDPVYTPPAPVNNAIPIATTNQVQQPIYSNPAINLPIVPEPVMQPAPAINVIAPSLSPSLVTPINNQTANPSSGGSGCNSGYCGSDSANSNPTSQLQTAMLNQGTNIPIPPEGNLAVKKPALAPNTKTSNFLLALICGFIVKEAKIF